MNLRTILAALVTSSCLLISSDALAQKGSSNDYNYQRALEILKESGDTDQALSLLNEQLKLTPNDPNTLLLMTRVYRNTEDYGKALSSINTAIKFNKPKKSGVEMSILYYWKAYVYEDMRDYEQAAIYHAQALEYARKDNKDNVDLIQNISFDLGQALYMTDRYDEALKVYDQMLKDDETDTAASVGIARIMLDMDQNQEAVDLLTRAQVLSKDYSEIYRYLMFGYDALGKTDKAIDQAIMYMNIDDSPKSKDYMPVLLKHKTYAVASIKEILNGTDDKEFWRSILASIYEESLDYENAIKELDGIIEDYGKDDVMLYKRARNYGYLGLTDFALRDIDEALEFVQDMESYALKGEILSDAGRYDEAVECYTKVIDYRPKSTYGYHIRGLIYELAGEFDKALDDYTFGLDLDEEDYELYSTRAILLRRMGDLEGSMKDFEKVIQLDTIADVHSVCYYALAALGKEQEAIEWMDKIIESDPDDPNNLYDKASLLAFMGRGDETVKALEKALEKGYINFPALKADNLLDFVRERDDFKAVVSRYEAKLQDRIAKMDLDRKLEKDVKIVEVPIKRHAGGTFDIECSVNGLPLNMIFDTGASDVTISKVEADFMFKNKYLSSDDIKGKQYYQVANGDISEGNVITLKEVKIGDAVLRNVNASVVKNQSAPLLLGESVLRKFGTFTVDNINSKLIIKQ